MPAGARFPAPSDNAVFSNSRDGRLRHSLSFVNLRRLQRRARRHATINVVDVSDVTRFQNMVDVTDVTTCQNIRKVSEHMYPDKNVM